MSNLKIWIIFFLIASIIVVIISKCGKKFEELSTVKNDSLQIALENWRADSLGCLHQREKYSDYISNYLNLNVKSLNELFNNLGPPNIIINSEMNENILYYTTSICNENSIMSENICFLRITYIDSIEFKIISFIDCH